MYILLITLLSFSFCSYIVWQAYHKDAHCVHSKVTYTPSSSELHWYELSKTNWTTNMWCETINLWKDRFGKEYSKFEYIYNCHGKEWTHQSMIEPLVAALRHPLALCGGDLLSRDYLVLANISDTTTKKTRKYMFDLGASTWSEGPGGSSQDFLYNAYKELGIDFDQIYLWEANKLSKEEIFKGVPDDILDSYKFFNIPASPTLGDAMNPLTLIEKIAVPSDFVVVKIDIDNFSIENSFISQIASSRRLLNLIDELFFEHHVNFQPLVSCCWQETSDPNASLHTSYKLFTELRRHGIRMHGWP